MQRSMPDKHLVISCDYDGTLNFNTTTADNFIDENQGIIDDLLRIILRGKYITVHLISGSARQCYSIEEAGKYISSLPSTAAFELLCNELNSRLRQYQCSTTVRLHKGLLADVHANITDNDNKPLHGQSYEIIRQKMTCNDTGQQIVPAVEAIEDHSKLLLLSWQMDYFSAEIAAAYPNQGHIDFWFIDDRGKVAEANMRIPNIKRDQIDLISPLVNFFAANPTEIPHNVTFHAAEKTVEGTLNHDYAKTIGKGLISFPDFVRTRHFEKILTAYRHMPDTASLDLKKEHIISFCNPAKLSHKQDSDQITLLISDRNFLAAYSKALMIKQSSIAEWSLFTQRKLESTTCSNPDENQRNAKRKRKE